MPPPLDVDWPAIQVLAQAVGVREAARQCNISEDAVMQRSCRESWLKALPRNKPLPPTMIQAVSNVSAPQDALANYSGPTRLGHAKAGARLAREYARMAEAEDVGPLREAVPEMLAASKHASITHNWNQQITNIGIRLDAVQGSLGVSMEQPGDEESGELE